MTDTIHPSDEQLTAFFDKQLPDHKTAGIEDHVSRCDACRGILSDFSVLQDMGPVIDELMPSDLYWEDLPDRILARITAEGASGRPAAVAAAQADSGRRPWWQALWTPALRWSTATAVVAVAGFAVINSLGGEDSTVAGQVSGAGQASGAGQSSDEAATEPAGTELAGSGLDGTGLHGTGLPANEPAAHEPLAELAPVAAAASMEPAEYEERIAHTLARDGNLGIQLDGTAGRASGGYVGYSPIQTVSLGLTEFRNVAAAPGASLEQPRQPNPAWYFFTALHAEASGKCDLAQAGYHLARARTQPMDPLHKAAEAGLTRCAWRSAITQSGNRSADTLDQLRTKAEASFDEHAAGRHENCVKAWELWVAYLELGKGSMTAGELQEGKARLRSLAECVE